MVLTLVEVPSPMRMPLAPYVISLCGFFLSVLAPLIIRWACCEAMSGAETSVLPWEHKQTWPCDGHFSWSSHVCWQHRGRKSQTPMSTENPRKQVRSAHSSPCMVASLRTREGFTALLLQVCCASLLRTGCSSCIREDWS